MTTNGEFGPAIHQVRLERLKMMATSMLPDDIPGVAVQVEMIEQAELKGRLLAIRALVTAAKREDEPYTVSDAVVRTVSVPERPVRDGMLLWLSSHTPGPLARACERRLRLREIPERRHVVMQKLHYYGCPHVRVGRDSTDVHLVWMATQSGQIPPDEAGRDA